MAYDKQILQILTEVGEKGIGVQALTKHVYNQSHTFFFTPDMEEIHRYVQQYLLRNSKSEQSVIERTGKRGHYRLNTRNSADARQLLLEFGKEVHDEKPEDKPIQDLSLDLFL